MSEVIVPVSKKKLIFATLGSLSFCVLGVLMLREPHQTGWKTVTAVAALIFFGFSLVVLLVRLFDSRPGVIISSEGFQQYGSFGNLGFIPWEEVDGIDRMQVQRQRLVRVRLKDPERFISQFSGLKKRLLKANHRMYGSPVHVSPVNLSLSFEDLWHEMFDAWRKSQPQAAWL